MTDVTQLLWKPRASGLGNHLSCLWRAAQDRLKATGQLPKDILDLLADDDTSYADLGTCIHFVMQDGMRGIFPQRAPEGTEVEDVLPYFNNSPLDATQAFLRGDPRAYQPSPAQWRSAATLFNNNLTLVQEIARKGAELGARYAPPSPDGKPWLVEPVLDNGLISGHMDFLSQDGRWGGDLKTTSRPPVMARLKQGHLAQMVAYHILKPTLERVWVLYLDSQRASWASLVWIDFKSPKVQWYIEQIRDFILLLNDEERLLSVAWPNMGDHCRENRCPYRKSCYEGTYPPPGRIYDAAKAAMPTGPMKLSGMTLSH